MTKPMIRIHNSQTDEVIDREMTSAELKIYETNQKAAEKSKAEADAKTGQRQAILDRIGLTADELKLLLG
jgi:hypothetical protein